MMRISRKQPISHSCSTLGKLHIQFVFSLWKQQQVSFNGFRKSKPRSPQTASTDLTYLADVNSLIQEH